MALANSLLITAKHTKGLKYGGETNIKPENFDWQPVHMTDKQVADLGRDAEGYPLQGVEEAPGYSSSSTEHCSRSVD